MFCLIGLGNPGVQYQETRHNAGFLVIEAIANHMGLKVFKQGFHSHYHDIRVGTEKVLLVKPQTYMNLSGQAVQEICAFYKLNPAQILVVYDDLDLPVGVIRIRLSGRSSGHKGLSSIMQHLGTDQLPRLRIGIGKPEARQPVPDYVLTSFSGPERDLFLQGIERAAGAALSFVSEGPDYAMNHFNTNPVNSNQGKEIEKNH